MAARRFSPYAVLAVVAGGALFVAAWNISEPRRDSAAALSAPPEADALFQKGRDQYRRKEYSDAKKTLEQCLAAYAIHAECHKLLGATLGRLGDGIGGAREYERFLLHAPKDHPQRAKVEALLEAYRQNSPTFGSR